MRVDEHTIEVAGSPVFYRSAAGSKAPVLYLHGVPTSSDDWLGFMARTGGIAPDLPGFGRSGKAGNLDYSIDGYADFVERLLDALEVREVRLVAHDWGAAAGLAFAQRQPERVRRIVLCDAIPLLPGFRWPRLARVWRTRVLGELLMGSINGWALRRHLRAGSVTAGAWSDERLAAVWDQFDQGTQRAILRLHRATDEAGLAAAGGRLGELDIPALVVWGERDPWLAAELADAYAQRLPKAVSMRFDDAGHWPWLDRPEVIDRVSDFLEHGS